MESVTTAQVEHSNSSTFMIHRVTGASGFDCFKPRTNYPTDVLLYRKIKHLDSILLFFSLHIYYTAAEAAAARAKLSFLWQHKNLHTTVTTCHKCVKIYYCYWIVIHGHLFKFQIHYNETSGSDKFVHPSIN